MPKTRVAVVDDHPLVRAGLRALLEGQADLEVAWDAERIDQARQHLKAVPVDVMLLDLEFRDGSGLDLLREVSGSVPVLVITSHTTEAWAITAMRLGARGYLRKTAAPGTVLAAVRCLAEGGSMLEPELARQLADAARLPLDATPAFAQLSARELEVLRLVALALPNDAIARQLSVSEKTVKTHVSALLSKLNVVDRTGAAVLAWRLGLVRDEVAQPSGEAPQRQDERRRARGELEPEPVSSRTRQR
ncbi:MAG: response regulator transcription factor [Myxococcaceae bacterium]|nr:response regulator transcription factor [Myxococcaceae bacterium]